MDRGKSWRGLGLWVGLCLSLSSCRASRTPETACEHLLRALSEGDASAVFDSLLQSTQWSFYTVVKNHGRMRKLILASYPPEQQAAALGRLYGSEASSGRDLFLRIYPERYEKDFNGRLGTGPMQVTPTPSSDSGAPQRLCSRQGGQPFILQSASGKWGLAELDREWDEAQLRTFHDLSTVQKNAELYHGVQPTTK